MLVLLHFHTLGYNPLEISLLFLLYEAMGIVTNLFGGWLATVFGLKKTLITGMGLQIAALVMLSLIQSGWSKEFSVLYVVASQGLSGVAKDLTKLSSKSAIKFVVDGDDGLLFKWIALLTGSKNTLKGVGFFLGGGMLSLFGFQVTLWILAVGLGLALLIAGMMIRGEFVKFGDLGDLGAAGKKVSGRELFSKTRNINYLSSARVFLFASRDVWFVVGLPLYLTTVMGWSFTGVGGFMACWVIGYGIIQAVVPKFLRNSHNRRDSIKALKIWTFMLCLIPLGILSGMPSEMVLLGGLGVFAVVFAINSAVHSYLIVAFSDKDKIALNVGFYYMANASGRLLGTFLSGVSYQYAGLSACLWVSAGMILVCAVISLGLRDDSADNNGAVYGAS
jgi:predicted MFS family arabinose efflux permease